MFRARRFRVHRGSARSALCLQMPNIVSGFAMPRTSFSDITPNSYMHTYVHISYVRVYICMRARTYLCMYVCVYILYRTNKNSAWRLPFNGVEVSDMSFTMREFSVNSLVQPNGVTFTRRLHWRTLTIRRVATTSGSILTFRG